MIRLPVAEPALIILMCFVTMKTTSHPCPSCRLRPKVLFPVARSSAAEGWGIACVRQHVRAVASPACVRQHVRAVASPLCHSAKRPVFFFLFLLACIVAALSASAQSSERVVLSGRVRDYLTGEDLSHVLVTVMAADSTVIDTVNTSMQTNSPGRWVFVMPALPATVSPSCSASRRKATRPHTIARKRVSAASETSSTSASRGCTASASNALARPR